MSKKKFTSRYDGLTAHHLVEAPDGQTYDYGTGYDASVRARREAKQMNDADASVRRLAAWERKHPEALKPIRRRKGR